MTLLTVSQAEDELHYVVQQFTQWRQRRTTPRGRIPQALWEQAVALTHVLPLSRVAQQLGLCPQRLRKRGGGKAVASGAPAQPVTPSFVEVTPAWRSPTCTINAVVCMPVRSSVFAFPCAWACACACLVLFDQRQDPPGRIILKDHLALRRQLLQALEDGMGTVAHDLALIPLRGIGHRHADQRLEPFEPMPRQAQVVARQR